MPRIRAAVLEEFGRPLVVRDVDLEDPKAGEVLVRLEATGVCHTDLYTASGADPSGYAPTVLGHEGAGLVEAVGAGVTSVEPGDRVLTLFSPQCRAFEATGNVKVMRQAVESARMGWGLCTVAGVAGRGEVLEVIPRFLITGRRIAGASFGGAKGRDRVPELVRLYLDGKLDLESFISHRMPLDDVNEAFELMERQDGIRSVLQFS
jgi:Zn-dependent alcohol dehydrogenase